MPGRRIKDLTALSGAGSANNDDVVIFDTNADTTKRISRSQLAEGMTPDLPLQYYLGVLNSNPTQRLNGDALMLGDYYLDAVTKYTTIYNGSGWNSYASVIAVQTASEAARDAAIVARNAAQLAETNAETAETNAELAETNAELAEVNAEAARDAALAAQVAAELAEVNAETARDAAFVNANVYANTTAGLAAVALGEQFQVVSGDWIIRYREDAGPVATEVARYPSSETDVFYRALGEDKIDAALYSVFPNYANTFVTRTGSNQVTLAVGADCWFHPGRRLDQIGITVADVILEVEQGTVDGLVLDQRNAAGTVLSTHTAPINEGGGIWATRGITLDAAFSYFRLRIKNLSGGGPAIIKPPVISATGRSLATISESKNSLAAKTLSLSDNIKVRNIYSIYDFGNIVGSGATVSGRTITVPAEVIGEGKIPLTGIATASDTLTIVYKASAPHRSGALTPATGLPGGSGVSLDAAAFSLGNDWYYTTGSAAAAAGANPAYASLRIDNRSQAPGLIAVDPLVVSDIWVGVNIDGIPAFITAPASTIAALEDAGVSAAYVDPVSGSDSNDGSSGAPLATIAAAVAAGAARIFCRKSSTPHRLASGLSVGGVEFIGYAESGDTQKYARIWSSQNIVAASWTVTVADANTYFYATAVDPAGMWEVAAAGTIARMGVDSVVPGRRDEAASEAAVRASAGAWWFGTGTEGQGIYIHPYGSSITGKSYEVPTANVSIVLNGGRCGFEGVEVCFGRSNAVSANLCTVTSKWSRFGRSGDSDGVSFGSNAHWTDLGDCEYFDAGDDGVNTNGGNVTFIALGGSKAYECRGDGVAPHGNGQTVILCNMDLVNNYKQGFVTIGTGTFKLKNCTLTGNYDVDLLVQLGAASVASVIELDHNTSDSCSVSVNTPSLITGFIHNHNGPLSITADVDVMNQRFTSKGGGTAFRVDGGTVSLTQFYHGLGNSGIGIDQRGGTLTVKTGQILRGTTGITKTGGTITLDSDYPVNVPGTGVIGAPATRTSGLTAGEIAELVSVAAV